MRLELVWRILLYKSFEKVFIWGWIWFEAFCFTNPLRKVSFEAEAGLKHLALQILWERLHLRLDLVWSFFFYKSLNKTSLEAGAGLKHFSVQILKERLHLRLELVWSILLYKSFEKIFIWGWIWFEACCFTNPLRISCMGRRSQILIFARKWSIWRHLGRPGLEMPKFSKTVGCQKPYKILCKMLRQTRFQASGRPGTVFEVSGGSFIA